MVVASTPGGGIGKEGKLPWHLPGDMAFFKALTTSPAGSTNAVLMGRNTWLSLPPKFQPLPGRLNVVISASGRFQAAGGCPWPRAALVPEFLLEIQPGEQRPGGQRGGQRRAGPRARKPH